MTKVGELSKGRTEEMRWGWGAHRVGVGCSIPGSCHAPLTSALVNPREAKSQSQYVKGSGHTHECPRCSCCLLLTSLLPFFGDEDCELGSQPQLHVHHRVALGSALHLCEPQFLICKMSLLTLRRIVAGLGKILSRQ